jgi:hypothetical protein
MNLDSFGSLFGIIMMVCLKILIYFFTSVSRPRSVAIYIVDKWRIYLIQFDNFFSIFEIIHK